MIRAVLTLEVLFEQLYIPARLSRASRGHIVQIRLSIARFRQYVAEARGIELGRADVDVADISDETIDGFKAWRSKVAAPTLNKDLRNLRLLINFACKRKKRAQPIEFEFEKEFVDPPEAFWPDELKRFFASCTHERGVVPTTSIPADCFWPALGAAIYSTGARIGIVMLTPLANLDLERGFLRLWAADNKQRKGQIVELHPETIAALRRISLPPREMLFPWPFDRQGESWPTLTRHLRRILTRAGLPTDSKHLFHCLRRTTATRMTAAGGIEKAREQLGHSTSKVTNGYVDLRQVQRTGSRDLIAPPPLAERDAGARQLRLEF